MLVRVCVVQVTHWEKVFCLLLWHVTQAHDAGLRGDRVSAHYGTAFVPCRQELNFRVPGRGGEPAHACAGGIRLAVPPEPGSCRWGGAQWVSGVPGQRLSALALRVLGCSEAEAHAPAGRHGRSG